MPPRPRPAGFRRDLHRAPRSGPRRRTSPTYDRPAPAGARTVGRNGEEPQVPQQTQDPIDAELSAAWSSIQERLQASVEESTYHLWFSELRPVSARGSILYLTGPAQKAVWVERRYAEVIDYALAASCCGFSEWRLIVGEAPTGLAQNPGRADPRSVLNPSYSFERFVIGAGNRVAHGAALAVAEAPGEAYNPLFLHGPPGLGKTHLLGAIAHYLSLRHPELAVHYTTAESFTNEFLASLQIRATERFKERYRRIDVLLIDDVQFLEGKSRTADEFFHTFNALHDAGAQIVLSADRLPDQLSALAERLRQRFEWGLIVDLEAPDLPTRLTVLDRLLADRGEQLDADARARIAERAQSNLRLLEGALTRVVALSSLTGSPPSSALVDRALPHQVAPSAPPSIAVDQIGRLVAERLDLDPTQLSSPSRAAPVTRARQLAMYLTRELTDLSLPAIARAFGRRDHTTVINALRQVQRRLTAEHDFQLLVGELTTQLRRGIDRDRTD